MGRDSSDRLDAFEAFFVAHRGEVLRYIARRAAPAVVEDVLAETFVVAWRRWEQVPSDPLPWLLAVARRVLANQRRGERRQLAVVSRLRDVVGHESAWTPVPGLDPEIFTVLKSLSEKEREALLLSAWEGLDSDRAAVVVGCSPAAFRARLHRARVSAAAQLSVPVPAMVPAPSGFEKGSA